MNPRKLILAVTAAAVAVSLTSVAAADAANVYTTTQAKVSPTKSGTSKKPKPVRLQFGFTAAGVGANRPSVTTDYVIGFGSGIRANHRLRDARHRYAFPRCSRSKALASECKSSAKVGSGTIDNLAGLQSDLTQKIPCRLKLTLYNGDGKYFPRNQNDGRRVRTDVWLGLKGSPSTTGCPLNVAAPLPAQFVRYQGGTALAFHVPRVPFQQPVQGLDNAVVSVISSVYRTRRVTRKVRVRGHTRIRSSVRGYLESVRCRHHHHTVAVRFTDATGTTGFASRQAACRS